MTTWREADTLVRYPLNPAFISLNLAQAVMVMAYEWWTAADDTPGRVLMTNETEVATQGALDGFLDHLIAELDACGFLRNLPKRPGMVRNIRHLFERGEVTEQEIRTLHGIVAELSRGRMQRGRPERVGPRQNEARSRPCTEDPRTVTFTDTEPPSLTRARSHRRHRPAMRQRWISARRGGPTSSVPTSMPTASSGRTAEAAPVQPAEAAQALAVPTDVTARSRRWLPCSRPRSPAVRPACHFAACNSAAAQH